ncbi:CASP-like protein 4A1 isoform X2 [Phragmites australis]|uniref:CASP-like protein 4A1 isoform X2 n=1 Tax=Phragmites australis TaxID=29695 RepID=UPI002D76CEBA|nr:CASP-like protein 4A1 isoform X2 [Phragmites australis]
MAPEVQASPSPSPPRAPDTAVGVPADPPPLTPARGTGNDWSEPEKPRSAPRSPPPPLSTDVVVVASELRVAAAKYVPPRAVTRTADPDPGRGAGWYTWSGARTAAPASRPAPPPRRQRQGQAEVRPPAPAPAPAPTPAPAPAPTPAPAPARPVDRVVPDILSRKRDAAALQGTALVARGAAALLCLVALAVLAADTRKGWALDSYSRYSQFRYSEAVNVIGFVYSVFQFVALAELMRKNKHLIPHPKRDIFDFTMDQGKKILWRIIRWVLPDSLS